MGHPIDSGLSYFFLIIIFLGISVSIKCKLKERFYELLSDKPGQVTSSCFPIKFIKKLYKSFLFVCCFIICSGCSISPQDKQTYSEMVLENKYGKDFTVDSIYGGDYSGIYSGKAHANDNPDVIFTFRNNIKDESLNSWSDRYNEGLKGEEYREEFDDILNKYDKDYYVYIKINNRNSSKPDEEPDYFLYYDIYLSNDWLEYSNEELWEMFSEISEQYGNFYMIFVTSEDLCSIKEECRHSDDISQQLSSYLDGRYSIHGDSGETRQGKVIMSPNDKENDINDIEEARNNELFR